jgi:NAD-dependent SIR2 family protein deacetylase
MSPKRESSVFVVGAGFSLYAGMPLQRDFTDALLSGRGSASGNSGKIVQHLRKFVNAAFDHTTSADAKFWPELEDIFTCIDLSANTGHNLGSEFSPSDLRTIRRGLIYRIISMLRERYREARKRKDTDWQTLASFFQRLNPTAVGFIATNWDTVVEDMLTEAHGVRHFGYGCDAICGSLRTANKEIKETAPVGPKVPVIKMHGSVNWLYCDNCRRLFWMQPDETYKVAGQLLSSEDWNRIDPASHHSSDRWHCGRCGADSLGTRFATFSYRKALDFPMFQKSWFSAERLLRNAKHWIFIGYSLPAADFEFKYLLKRVQLSRRDPPNFAVVSGGDLSDRAYQHYQHFFGREIKKGKNFFGHGLERRALAHISGLLAA